MSRPQTLGDYRKIARAVFPDAVPFLNSKIEESPNGEDEKVIAAESQMLYLLANIKPDEEGLGDE